MPDILLNLHADSGGDRIQAGAGGLVAPDIRVQFNRSLRLAVRPLEDNLEDPDLGDGGSVGIIQNFDHVARNAGGQPADLLQGVLLQPPGLGDWPGRK